MDKDLVLKNNEIYVGQGDYRHRLPTTKWASPFLVGHHGTAEECTLLYIDWLHKTGLAADTQTLMGKVLLCDIPLGEVSTADVLIAECWNHLGTSSTGAPAPKAVKRARNHHNSGRAVLTLVATGGDLSLALTRHAHTRAQAPLCPRVKVMWQQEAVATAFARLYPPGIFDGFSFPFIEDIINGPPFSTYSEWREQEGLSCGAPLPPAIFSKKGGGRARRGLWSAGWYLQPAPGAASVGKLRIVGRRPLL